MAGLSSNIRHECISDDYDNEGVHYSRYIAIESLLLNIYYYAF
jgi:hypothetical protein